MATRRETSGSFSQVGSYYLIYEVKYIYFSGSVGSVKSVILEVPYIPCCVPEFTDEG